MTIHFEAGRPWRRKAEGSPRLDYSDLDSWVCPVYCRPSGGDRWFIVDVVIDCIDSPPNGSETPVLAQAKAEAIANALNLALKDREWTVWSLPFLGVDLPGVYLDIDEDAAQTSDPNEPAQNG